MRFRTIEPIDAEVVVDLAGIVDGRREVGDVDRDRLVELNLAGSAVRDKAGTFSADQPLSCASSTSAKCTGF